jgi:hypothetical protein
MKTSGGDAVYSVALFLYNLICWITFWPDKNRSGAQRERPSHSPATDTCNETLY